MSEDANTFLYFMKDFCNHTDEELDSKVENHGNVVTIDFESSLQSGELHLKNIDETPKGRKIQAYLSETYQMWHNIKFKSLGDAYLKAYNELPLSNLKVNLPESARNQLFGFKQNYYGHLIKLLKEAQLNCLIAGSAALASTIPNLKWQPNDIDLYLKDISYESILDLNHVIKQSLTSNCYNPYVNKMVQLPIFGDSHVLLVRKSLTLNWIIFNPNGEVELTIQLNLLNIQSWAELFVCYHSDPVCIGYDVQSDQLIYLEGRWIRYLTTQFSSNRSHYYCNFLNLDTPNTLYNACLKYGYERGIQGQCLFVTGCQFKNSPYSLSSDPIRSKSILKYLDDFCHDQNFAISSDIRDLIVENEETPNMIDLKDLKNHPQFSQRPKMLQDQLANNLGTLTDNDCYFIHCNYIKNMIIADPRNSSYVDQYCPNKTISTYTKSRFYLLWTLAIYYHECIPSFYCSPKLTNQIPNKYRYLRINPLQKIKINARKNQDLLVSPYNDTMKAKLTQRQQLITKILHTHPVYNDVIGHILSFIWPKIKS
jgi:hypothetical protein